MKNYQPPMPRQFDPREPHEGIGLCSDVPMDGKQTIDEYKRIAANGLAQQIVQFIEPEFIEANGFEVLRYPLVVLRNGDDGRNYINKDKVPIIYP
jgi:hypothetical protein